MSTNIQAVASESRYRPESDLRALIGVREPYFALRGLIAGNAGAQAGVNVEQLLGRERGVITAAEAARHLSILGACALARVNPVCEPRYYLATEASLVCIERNASPQEPQLLARAAAVFESKRRGRAHCTLYSSSGGRLFELEIGFAVLTQNAFERSFAGLRRETAPDLADNPHLDPLPLTGLVLEDQRASFLLPRLEARLCAGHFDHYPLLPAATVMQALTDLAGELLQHLGATTNSTYVVQRADLEVHHFAKPSEALRFEAEYFGSDAPSRFSFVCHASVPGGARIATLRLVLSPR